MRSGGDTTGNGGIDGIPSVLACSIATADAAAAEVLAKEAAEISMDGGGAWRRKTLCSRSNRVDRFVKEDLNGGSR